METRQHEELIGRLRDSPIFSALTEAQIEAVGQVAKIEEYPPNTLVSKAGESSTHFFYILDGQVEVHPENRDPSRLGRGEFFGETTLIANLTRSANVLSLRKTRCLVLRGSDLRSYPSLVLRLLEASSRKDRIAETQSTKTVKPTGSPPTRAEAPGANEEMDFKSERARTLFDYIVRCFTRDYMVARLYFEQAGWRSLGEISAGTKIPRDSLYGRHGSLGPAIGELVSRGLIETRMFSGERGRGGEVVKVRIAYDKDPVKRYVDKTVMKRK